MPVCILEESEDASIIRLKARLAMTHMLICRKTGYKFGGGTG